MKIEYKMNLPVSEVYRALATSAVLEANLADGKKRTMEDFEHGFKYKGVSKASGREVPVTVHVRKPQPYRNIHISNCYPATIYEMDYTLEKIDDQNTLLTFQQIDVNNKEKKAGFLFEWRVKRKFRKMEKQIKKNRQH